MSSPLSPPLEDVSLTVYMSERCNIRCVFCFQDHTRGSSLDESVLYGKLLPVYHRTHALTLQGGEVTILPGTRGYLTFLQSRHPRIRLTVFTNGVEFGEEWARLALAAGMDVVFSLNAADGARYREVVVPRPGADQLWARAFGNLRGLLKMRSTFADSSSRVPISMVITADSVEEDITDFVRLGAAVGLPVRLLVDQPFGGGLLPIVGTTVCRAPWHALTLTASGEVLFCPHLPGYVLGNINRE
jgi:MoaA/NifB/PqqE/SkfB family radical SAM enzyme